MSKRPVLVSLMFAAVFGAGCDKGGGSGGGDVKALEQRVAKLEDEAKSYRDMLKDIKPQWEASKKRAQQQAEEEEANTPAEDAVFAVDIAGNQIEGPASGAYVTIIEAWDFA